VAVANLLTLGETRLETRHVGPPPSEAPTLVLLHEGLGCVALWKDFPERLAAATGWGVFAWSRQGYGGSSPCALPRPLTYMQDEARDVLPRLFDAIGLQRAVLLGHSDGGSIAAAYAGMYPEDPRIAGLILHAPHFFTEPQCVAAIDAATAAFTTGDLRARLARYHGDNVDCAFHGWSDAWRDPGFLDFDLRPFLPSVRVPVQMVQGTNDPYGTLAQVRVLQAHCGAPVDEVLLDCGHAPFKEAPDAVLAASVRFVSALGG